MRRLRMIICSVLFALAAAAQEQSSPDSVRPQENKHTLMGGIRQVQHYLDEKARAKVDSHYIEVPGKPWSVILRYNANGFRLDYDSHIDFPGTNESADWQLCFEPPMASSIGFSVGYRGTGFSFSKSLTENAGRRLRLQFCRSDVRAELPAETAQDQQRIAECDRLRGRGGR